MSVELARRSTPRIPMPTVLKHYSSYRDGNTAVYDHESWLKNTYDLLERLTKVGQRDKELVRAENALLVFANFEKDDESH